MKKILSICLFLTLVCSVSAQGTISVKSFRKLQNDMDARLNETAKKDFNGEPSAIIKVVTTQTGFTFDCGSIGIVKTINKPSEIWVYVPHGAKRISIFHEKLGQIRDWMFTEPIEKSTVYELVLTTGKVITTVEETIESQWLVINTEPADASVYLNDLFVKSGTYQTKLKPGSYTYRVEAPLYHTEAGKVEITDTKKEITANLKPAFGFISVSSEPEKEAKVIIDGKALTTNTPCKSEGLASGEHTVQVIKEMYQPSTQKVTITDGQTTPVNFKLQPNFAELNMTTSAEATLYVNNEQKAKGKWNGRLNPGVYSLEARMDKHRPAKQDIELAAGDVKTKDLQPTPIYGTLDISTTPVGATISINGKEYGTTPNTVHKLLIGDYTVKLRKEGYATVSKIATIVEGKSVEVNETLANGRPVTISSTPTAATLYIDGNASGNTPYTGSLTFGNHTLVIESNGKKAEKTASITQTGGETSFMLSFGPQTFTETIKGVRFDMVAVQGGSFSMGSESGEDCEKPVHSVTLSDFAIGKTEVTQALWQKVMGNNPSNWKGDNLPVEQVSWDDIQGFIIQLNQLTGKSYRLPTEAEWEYAARGGVSSRSTTHAGSNTIADVAWYTENSGSQTHSVAGKQPNELGLYDMTGNVWEWCSDWYGAYSDRPQTNPTGATNGSLRVFRGGSWYYDAQYCRTAYRNYYTPGNRFNSVGFRLVVSK
ncbi:MAG: SUMF1/EgtB/PvdO family nonheme iron enzyme [Paludibacter sp.]